MAPLQEFSKLSPIDAAHSLEELKHTDAIALIESVGVEAAVPAFDHLDTRFAAKLISELSERTASQIFSHMSITRAADLLLALNRKLRVKFLRLIDRAQAEQIRKIIIYPKDTAGRMMTPSFFAFQDDTTVGTAIQTLRFLAQKKIPFSYVYVIDSEKRLKGVLNMRELLLTDDDAPLSSIMSKDVFCVEAVMDREKVIQETAGRSFLSVPVVDKEGHLLGIVRTGELIQTAQEEATEDIQKMFGAGGDERVFSPITFSMRKRLFWLYINLGTAFLAASVISLFEGAIAKITALAIFLPIVASQGGNAGAQTLAVVMRGLVLGEVDRRLALKVIAKEGTLGLLNGILMGIVTAFGAWLWHKNIFLGAAIGLAMIINLVAAGVSGASIPILMRALGKDPAQSSNIILTTVTDCVGYFAFLSIAALFGSLLLN